MTLLSDPETFVTDHRPHGQLVAAEGPPTASGYRLTVCCPRGVVFERWITPQDAALDLALMARWSEQWVPGGFS